MMNKKKILVFLFQMVWFAGFSQSVSLEDFGWPFQRTNLVVHWNAPTNALPSTVWSYRLMPRRFPEQAISNLATECGYTESDQVVSNSEEIMYKNKKFPSAYLGISSSHGVIFYQAVTHYGPTNLAKNVPTMEQMRPLTTNFLSEFGINLFEIEKNENGDPNFHFWEPLTEYYVNPVFITNVEFRAVSFRRSVDGGSVRGVAGHGRFEFGENDKPVGIDFDWPVLGRYKSYSTPTPEIIIERIREGRARQGLVPDDFGDIDWHYVKTIIVKKTEICYYAGDSSSPSPWLVPLVALWTTVEAAQGNIDVEIICPIIDETNQ